MHGATMKIEKKKKIILALGYENWVLTSKERHR